MFVPLSYHILKRILVLFAVLTLLSSCASMLNQPHTSISLYTTQPSVIVQNHDTLQTTDNKASLLIERKREPLMLILTTDSIKKTIRIEPGNSLMYWSNILFNYGLGMLYDKNKPKRYGYPLRVYVNSSDTTQSYSKYGEANNKGEWGLHLSLPYINSFYMEPAGEGIKGNTGFWGLSMGLDYYHSKNQFVAIGITYVTDFFAPFPGAIDYGGEYEIMSTGYISLTNNIRNKRLAYGYGFTYARNTWYLGYNDKFDALPPSRSPIKKTHDALGFIIPVYYQLGQYFNLGLVYRPTFYCFECSKPLVYEHLISVDLAWKIRLIE